MRIRRIIPLLVSAPLALCVAATATTLERMSVARMTHASQVIVRARCVENSTHWDSGEIWTITSFEVEEAWKGAPPARILVRLIGGRFGNLTSTVSGVPHFQPSEEVILFLEPTPRGDFTVVSWMQGTFRILHDPRSGEEILTQDTAAFATFDPAARRFEFNGIRNLPLAALRAQVTAAVRKETVK
ncbi:MAG: hypothetical protein WBP79_11570 [Candidatus Acidiferrales bacterium]